MSWRARITMRTILLLSSSWNSCRIADRLRFPRHPTYTYLVVARRSRCCRADLHLYSGVRQYCLPRQSPFRAKSNLMVSIRVANGSFVIPATAERYFGKLYRLQISSGLILPTEPSSAERRSGGKLVDFRRLAAQIRRHGIYSPQFRDPKAAPCTSLSTFARVLR
jgi:hypothetical protein